MKEKLLEIHNALSSISVKGDDVIIMAKTIIALRGIIEEIISEQEEKVDGDI